MNICIVSHNSYGALVGDESRHIGGVEVQTNLMARWLTANGHKVSVIVWGEESGVNENIDGIQIISACRITDGIPIARFFYPRWTSLIQALRKADAEIYYQNCGEYITGQVAMWCKIKNKRFVYSVASDPDCDVELPNMHNQRERILYRYGLRNADLIIVQTEKQKKMLKQGFGLHSYVHPMPSKDSITDYNIEDRHKHFNVLWVGRLAPVKRLDRLINIAKKIEDCTFTVIGGIDQDKMYADDLINNMSSIKNIRYCGRIKNEKMKDYYKSASILCCTSDYEGFPNTFLEAWAQGLPIISTIDPDGLIERKGIGTVCKTNEDFINAIEIYRRDLVNYESVAKSARKYFKNSHAEDAAIGKFVESFKTLV